MLVLSRKVDQVIVIDHPQHGRITLQVMEIRDGKCRLGITAPRGVPIHRGEVWARLHEDDKP